MIYLFGSVKLSKKLYLLSVSLIYDISEEKHNKIEDIIYALHLYFDGLSLRNTSKVLSRFVKRSHTAIRGRIQKYKLTKKLSYLRKKIDEYIIDETLIKVGSYEYV